MPRLPPPLLRRAHNISPLLPLLLRACRTLPSAQNELRWLHEHVSEPSPRRKHTRSAHGRLMQLCLQRSSGVPLQYILGSTPFGELDILCRPGVLIPRPETEAYTLHLADLIRGDERLRDQDELRILDLCSGTGCISLSLYASLQAYFNTISVVGVDVSSKALELARQNVRHNMSLGLLPPRASDQIKFAKADLLREDFMDAKEFFQGKQVDIVISNPPYISQEGFDKDTARSVRTYEPRLALVPPSSSQIDFVGEEFPRACRASISNEPGALAIDAGILRSEDVFYPRILNVASSSGAKLVLMEIADLEQALRVCQYAYNMSYWTSVEVFKDWPDETAEIVSRDLTHGKRLESQVVRGQGSGRSVMCRKL